MSAENWGICPNCYKNTHNRIGEIEKELKSVSELNLKSCSALIKELEEMKGRLEVWEEEDETAMYLREDYEIFTDEEGIFTIQYSCECQECGFSYDMEEKRNILNPIECEVEK